MNGGDIKQTLPNNPSSFVGHKSAPGDEKVLINPVELPAVDRQPEKPDAEPTAQDINLKMLLDIPVDVRVEIGRTRVSIRDILQMGLGSIVELDRVAGQPADILVNGKLIGQGDIVVVNETFGLRITKLVGVEERLQSL